MVIIPDVSHWQGSISWGQMVAAGAKGVIVRAGSITDATGELYTDYKWEVNSIEAPKHLPMGAYWYFRPKYSGLAQAEYLYNLVKKADIKLKVYIDVETSGVSQTVARTRIKAFLDYLENKLGYKPGIYTSASKWNVIVGNVSWAREYDLWDAHYTVTQIKPYIPWGWSDYVLWQYTAKGPGATYGVSSASIDLNRFNGSEDDFRRHFGLGHAATIEERIENLEKWARTLGYGG